MTDREAMKLALEALDDLARYADTCELFLKETHPGKADALRGRVSNSIKAITAIKQARSAPVQEPVLWLVNGVVQASDIPTNYTGCLYTTPPAAQRQWVGLDWLPEHKCGLHLSHNEHRDVYETVEQFYDADDFISEEEWHKAVAEDSVWVLHWYPNTPVGFTRITASTLEAIEAKLKEKNT